MNQLIILEWISDHVDEHNVHIVSIQFQEQSVEAVRNYFPGANVGHSSAR